MRILLYVLLGLGGLWAQEAAMAEETLIVFTHPQCGPCQDFKRDLANNPELLESWPVELFDVKTAKEITGDFKVTTVPCFIVVKVTADNVIKTENEVRRSVGYHGPEKLQRWLKRNR